MSLILIGLVTLIILNFSTLFFPPPEEKYLSFNDVSGTAVVHRKIPYTLNFEQQNDLIELINTSIKISKENQKNLTPVTDFEQIIFYRFNAPDLILTPIGYENDTLIYEVLSWNPHGYLKESQGKLKTLISKTYDP